MDAVIATRNEEEGEGAVAVVATCNVAVIRKLSSTQVPVMMNFLCAEPTPPINPGGRSLLWLSIRPRLFK
jgi:hypothetical protein